MWRQDHLPPFPGNPAGPEEPGLGEVCVPATPASRLTFTLPWPAPYSTAGPGPPPPPGDGAAGCRRERRQERGRSQERRQPSSSSSEKQRFYSCDRFGGREPPQPKPSLSSHPTSPTAGQEPGPPRQVHGPRDPPCSHPHPIPSGPGSEPSPVLVPRPEPAPGFLACPSCLAGPWPSCSPVPSFSPPRLRWAGLCSPLPWPCAQPLLALPSHPPGASRSISPTCAPSLPAL